MPALRSGILRRRLLRSEILAGRVEVHVPSLAFIELANLLNARGLSSGDVVNDVRAAMSIGLIVHDFDEAPGEGPLNSFREGSDGLRFNICCSR